MKESNLTETVSVKDVMKALEKHLHIDVSELSNIKITGQHDNSKEMGVTFTQHGKKAGVKFPIKNGKIVGQPILGRRAAELVESFNMHAAKTLEKMVGKSKYSYVVSNLRDLASSTMIDDEFKDFKFSTSVSKVRPADKEYSMGLVRISNGHKNPRDKSNRIDIEVEMRLISGNPEFRVVTMGLDSKIVASDWQRDPSKAFKSFERQLPKNKGTAYMVESIKAQPPSGDMKKLLDEFGMMTTYRSYRRGTFKTFADKGEFAAIVLKIEYFDGKTHDDITSVSLETVGKTTAGSSLYRKLLKFNKVGETATHRWQTTHRPLVDSPRAPEPKKGTAFREYIVLALANEHLLESSGGTPNPKVVSEGRDKPSRRGEVDIGEPTGEVLAYMRKHNLMKEFRTRYKQLYKSPMGSEVWLALFVPSDPESRKPSIYLHDLADSQAPVKFSPNKDVIGAIKKGDNPHPRYDPGHYVLLGIYRYDSMKSYREGKWGKTASKMP